MKDTYYSIRRFVRDHSYEGYVILQFEILAPRYGYTDSRGMDLNTEIVGQWQSHYNAPGPSDWYGFKWVPRETSRVEKLKDAVSLAGKIAKACGGEPTPETFEAIMMDLKIERVVYDARCSRYVRPRGVLPSHYSQWAMDWRACGWDHNHGGLEMATDEDEARDKLLRDLLAATWACAQEKVKILEAWRTAGMPVMKAGYSNERPDTRAVADLIVTPKQEKERAAEREAALAASQLVEVAA